MTGTELTWFLAGGAAGVVGAVAVILWVLSR